MSFAMEALVDLVNQVQSFAVREALRFADISIDLDAASKAIAAEDNPEPDFLPMHHDDVLTTPDMANLRRRCMGMSAQELAFAANDAIGAAKMAENINKHGGRLLKTPSYYLDEAGYYRMTLRQRNQCWCGEANGLRHPGQFKCRPCVEGKA